jgi:cytosine/adenosine deaminase-related metal-dependent hydrolase
MTFALRARVVFPVDRPPIENGVVTIDRDGWIVAVGTATEAADVKDLGDVALFPALVNCHTHLEFSHLKKPLGNPGMRLDRWIRLVIAERGQSGEQSSVAIESGLRECARDGAALIGDIATSPSAAYEDRGHLLVPFVEVIGFSRARADSALVAVQKSLSALRNSCGEVGISPHAPYTVSPALLEKLIALSSERILPVAIHLAESEAELELLDAGTGPFQELLDERGMWDAEAIPRGSRAMDYLRMLAGAPRALIIHGNYLDENEIDFIGANADTMSIIYCPRTHAFFRHPPYPLALLLGKGAHVALGTDSRASNPDLNLWAEMRYVSRIFPTIDPQHILRMATLSGAEALGRDAVTGSITAGKLANLMAMPLESRRNANADEALESLLDSDGMPTAVWFQGIENSTSDFEVRHPDS